MIINNFHLKKWYYFSEMPKNLFNELYESIVDSKMFIVDDDFEYKFMKLF